METKNIIIQNHCDALLTFVNTLTGACAGLGDDISQNLAIIKTLNIIADSIRAQTVIIQQDLDSYSGV